MAAGEDIDCFEVWGKLFPTGEQAFSYARKLCYKKRMDITIYHHEIKENGYKKTFIRRITTLIYKP